MRRYAFRTLVAAAGSELGARGRDRVRGRRYTLLFCLNSTRTPAH